MFRMWGKIFHENHMLKDTVICIDSDLNRTRKVYQALEEICYEFDLSKPLWLDHNKNDFIHHSKTRFNSDSFVEDIDQQIFERILLHPDTALHVPEHEIIYYLFAIQRNVMYTLTMDEYKNSHYPLDYDDGNDISRNLIDPEDLFIRYIYLDSLKIIFSTLTPDFRDTIIFHYFYGFKYSEIACMFHISERAVKKRIAVAKKRVRTMFQKEDFL